jgi:hypothetical protein
VVRRGLAEYMLGNCRCNRWRKAGLGSFAGSSSHRVDYFEEVPVVMG